MSSTATSSRVDLELKHEDETPDGVPIGPLTYSNGEPVFPDGRWVTLVQARRLAVRRGVDLFEY